MPSATAQQDPRTEGGFWPFLALLGGNAALALGPWLVRLTDTGPVAAGFWRLAIPLPLFAFLAWRERVTARFTKATLLLLVVAGVSFALDLASWHIGIERTRLGNATLFGNSGSLILMMVGIVALRRLPTGAEALAILSALAGAAILFGQSLEISMQSLRGDLFCLLAGIFYVGYLLPAQRARGTIGQWSVLLVVCAAAAPVALGMSTALGEPVWPGSAGFGPVLALAFSSQVVGQGLLVFALKHFSPLIIGMMLLTQPALAALTGWLAFGETLAPIDILGMALIGAALVIARVRREKPLKT